MLVLFGYFYRMRKYFLSLVLICSVLLLAGMGDATPKIDDIPTAQGEVSGSYFIHPNTELDAVGFQNIVPANPVSRSSHPAVDFVCLANKDFVDNNFFSTDDCKYQVYFKDYLYYNYPSHNFW